MGAMASQITSLTIVYSTVYSGADQRKHQSSVSLAFVRGIHRWPVNSPLKWPVTRKMFSFDDVIMGWLKDLCAKSFTVHCTHYIIISLSWLSYNQTNCVHSSMSPCFLGYNSIQLCRHVRVRWEFLFGTLVFSYLWTLLNDKTLIGQWKYLHCYS